MSEQSAAPEGVEGVDTVEAKPALRIVTASTTPEEVAAIVAVLASLGGSAPAPKKQRSLWATPRMRDIAHSGAGAWRASGLTR